MDGLFGRLRAEILGREGRAWAGSVEDLLFDGESVRKRVSVGDNRVVVTSHRLLAFTPTRDGENYRQVDLPNVTDVRAGHDGEGHLLGHAARLLLYGGILLAVGLFFDFDSIVPTDVFEGTSEATGQMGLGGIIGMMQTFLGLVAAIDDAARLLGAGLFLFGLFVVAVYVLTRDPALVISVAGDDGDILVPTGDDGDPEAAAADIEIVLFDDRDTRDGDGFDGESSAEADSISRPDTRL